MRFADHFWNEQVDQFSGFATLNQRLKDGKHFCRDYVDFLKQRSQLEENYGKALLKIARGAGGKDEIGTLKKTWDKFRQETESVGQERICLSSRLMEQAMHIQEASESYRQRRKQAEEQVHRLQSARRTAYKKLLEIRAAYMAKSHQAEMLGQTLLVDMGKATISPKDIEKIKAKHGRCLVAGEQAEVAYRAAVDALDDLRLAWETETIVACDLFQELEEKRIETLRNSMWVVANHNSANCCSEDDNYEAVRKSLEECSFEKDNDLFIQEKQTGQQKPAPVTFAPYKGIGSCLEKSKLDDAPIIPLSPMVQSKNLANTVNTKVVSNELYDTTDILYPWRVLSDYKAQSDFELSLKENDYVRVTNQTDRDWWQVLTKDGQRGYFPSQQLQYGAHIDAV